MAASDKPKRVPLTEADVLAQIEAADKLPPVDEPTATSVVFNPETRRFSLHLAGGTSVEFDADAIWELKGAPPGDLADVGLSPSGSAITWPKLDMDVSVDGLVMDLLGSPVWRRALRRNLNRELARTKTEATARAARENGKKGGRPRKTAQG